MDGLRGAAGHQYFAARGYPNVSIDVRDRRLIISHTNLEQLELGLATVIADYVDMVSRRALVAEARRQEAAQLDMDERSERAAEGLRGATRIRFSPHPVGFAAGADAATLAQLDSDRG